MMLISAAKTVVGAFVYAAFVVAIVVSALLALASVFGIVTWL